MLLFPVLLSLFMVIDDGRFANNVRFTIFSEVVQLKFWLYIVAAALLSALACYASFVLLHCISVTSVLQSHG